MERAAIRQDARLRADREHCEAKGGAVERAAIRQDARLRADQGGPALRSPRAASASSMAPAARYG